MGLTQKLGTIPLAISTDASNNVGIGGSPSGSYKLEVTGTAKVSSTLLVSGAATFSSSVTALSGLFSNSGNSLAVTTSANSTTFMSVGINSGTNKSIFGFDVTDGGFVGTITNDDFTIRSNNTKRVTISASTGAATFSSSVTATKFMIGNDEGYALNINGGNAYGAFIKVTTSSVNIPLVILSTATTGDNNLITFSTDASIDRGTIKYNRTAGLVAYNTTSDYRLKSEILDFNALEIINNLKPKEFRIRDAESKAIGFIAHELKEYLPQAVSGEKDAVDEEGNPIYQGVDYSQLTALLTKAIQELKAEIDILKAK